MLSYCIYDKKTTANVPGSEKRKVAKNGQKYVISVCAVCGKKSLFFYQKSNATSFKYIFCQ